MNKSGIAIASALLGGLLVAALIRAVDTVEEGVVVAVPARAGAVDGTTQNSDEFLWRQFVQFVAPASASAPSPVVFETWASDKDVYATTPPRWPEPGEPKDLQASRLALAKTAAAPGAVDSAIDVDCKIPGNAGVGGFPTSGTPAPCIAEEVRRNRPQFDYIVSNNLYSKAGLAAAFAQSFTVTMPTTAIAVKGDWIPLPALLQWIPLLKSIDNIRTLYYTTVSGDVEYALVSMHVSSRQNANWVWGTFEHQMNPGRCDAIGCFDTFGAVNPAVLPDRAAVNSQYGTCAKTPALSALLAAVAPVWSHYCMKSTQVTYTAPDGTPSVLGNSVIEGIVGNGTIAASSCIACHVYASFGKDGGTLPGVIAMLPFNPTGPPIPGVQVGSIQYDFMWGVLNAQ